MMFHFICVDDVCVCVCVCVCVPIKIVCKYMCTVLYTILYMYYVVVCAARACVGGPHTSQYVISRLRDVMT